MKVPDDDAVREKIYAEIREAAPQLMDAMMSRLTEVLWPNGKFHNPSEPYRRPLRFYPDDPHSVYPYQPMGIQEDGTRSVSPDAESARLLTKGRGE